MLSEHFDCVILDLGLPDMDGLDVLKQARDKKVTTPVLILTARDQLNDKIRGLDNGADDYLLKPFDIEELEARLRALKRRMGGRASPNIIIGDVQVDPSARSANYKGDAVKLSRREYDLLLELASHPGQVQTRAKLEELLYGWNEEVESNAMEVHIHNLRKKLGTKFIRTVRGVGYVVDAEVAQ